MIPRPIEELIEELSKLPTIGQRTAARLAFFLVKQEQPFLDRLGKSILHLKDTLVTCTTCFAYGETDPCGLCQDTNRDAHTICVVEEYLDLVAIERSKQFHGRYHVLQGSIAPLQGIGPRELTIEAFQDRLTPDIHEIILATNPTMEGEATAMYLKRLINDHTPNIRITRIAKGLPMGGDIEYADDVTIQNSLSQRTTY